MQNLAAVQRRRHASSGPLAPAEVEYLVVAGGGGGSVSVAQDGGEFGWTYSFGGGGGGGGVKTGTGLSVSKGTTYTVTVGGGGSNSVFSTVTSTAGGNAGSWFWGVDGASGGSGGGGDLLIESRNGWSTWNSYSRPAGATVGGGQGYNGAGSVSFVSQNTDPAVTTAFGGSGGGAGEAGNTDGYGYGGDGVTSSISGASVIYGGGGGGVGCTGSDTPNAVTAPGGDGGGAAGSTGIGNNGTANTGGGGGGAGTTQANKDSVYSGIAYGIKYRNGGNGGSGIVILRYADTFAAATSTTGSPTYTVAGGYRIYKFTGSGSITW